MENIYTIEINNNYSQARLINDKKTILIEGCDKIGKLFHGDIVKYETENDQILLVKSNVNLYKITGILEFYSNLKFSKNKKGIERFKFTPFNKHFPSFLISSKCKSKYKKNVIVVVKVLSWVETFPFGEIIEILGTIDNMSSIYESVLYNKNLITNKVKIDKRNFKNINQLDENLYFDLRDKFVISIDPENTKDIDDALHYEKTESGFKIGIHISNVVDTLQYYRMEHILENINTFSTVYAPHRIVNMFYEELSNNILSLLVNKDRYAITLWVIIENNKIIDTTLQKTIIRNKKQYTYDQFEQKINSDKKICELYDCVKNLEYENINYEIFDTHKFIEKLMIIYNCEISKRFSDKKHKFIFRNQTDKIIQNNDNTDLDSDLSNFMNIINKNSANYSFNNEGHISLKLNSYTHITSPIRRYVDCYNQRLLSGYIDGYNVFPLNIDLNILNTYIKNIKRADRLYDKLKLKNIINETLNHKYLVYPYKFDGVYIYFYIKNINLTLQKKLINPKTENIFQCSLSDNDYVIIKNLQTDTIETVELYKKINIDIYCINNEPYPKFNIKINNCIL